MSKRALTIFEQLEALQITKRPCLLTLVGAEDAVDHDLTSTASTEPRNEEQKKEPHAPEHEPPQKAGVSAHDDDLPGPKADEERPESKRQDTPRRMPPDATKQNLRLQALIEEYRIAQEFCRGLGESMNTAVQASDVLLQSSNPLPRGPSMRISMNSRALRHAIQSLSLILDDLESSLHRPSPKLSYLV